MYCKNPPKGPWSLRSLVDTKAKDVNYHREINVRWQNDNDDDDDDDDIICTDSL